MKLRSLIEQIPYKELVNVNDYSLDVENVSYNSKTTRPNDIFVCITGEHTDGHEFFQEAVNNGAIACIVEKILNSDIPQVVVDSTQEILADLAIILNGNTSTALNLIGVTGTNGKTTVSHLLQKMIEDQKGDCALIGTLGYKYSTTDDYHTTGHTTPQAPELQSIFADIKYNKQISNVVMEVSSHALAQHRVKGCDFNGAIFTNLTQDHLDFHITMNNYFMAKAKLFENLATGDFAVINIDDEYGERLKNMVSPSVSIYTYAINNSADIMAKDVKFSSKGVSFTCMTPKDKIKVNLKMNGIFSVYNSLAAIAGAYAMGLDVKKAIKSIEPLKGVAGRFEIVHQGPMVIVDYAHTPDGLKNILVSANGIKAPKGKLICVFGCGGDRDVTKRPQMGAIAEELSDKVILTSDNPRSEDPQQILSDILSGFKSTDNVIVEADREAAIKAAKKLAHKDDIVVIAGKGHEDYQILKNKTIHFDDREEVKKIFH